MNDTISLRLQAESGDPRAQVTLAFRMLTGHGVPQEWDQARRLVETACAQKSADAFMLRASMSALGIGLPKKLDDAYNSIKQAAALGNAYAQGQLKVVGADALDRESWLKPIHLTPLSESPRVAMVEGFLPKPACDWLIKCAGKKLAPATVFDPKSGGAMRDPARTNSTADFNLLEADLVLLLACRRIASATGLPILNQEATSVLHYGRGEEYFPHHDFIRPWGAEAQSFAAEIAAYGQRAVTVLVYLNDDYEGGETFFPELNLRFKGKPGDALIFWNISASGELEHTSLHAGLPVTKGEKWLLSKWTREKPYPLI